MPVTNIINERDVIASNDSGELFPDNTTSTVSSSTTENNVNASNDSGELFLDQSDSYVDQLPELFDGNDGEFIRSVSSGSVNDYKNYIAESFMDADGVLAKADVLMTPYDSSNSVLNSVKPVEGTANFSFSRNSSATRVNELGYIEDVQIIGGELVSNGDFEEIGSELVTNGSFDTDSDWLFGGSASISGGAANFTGSGDLIRQDFASSGLFKITFTTSGTGYLVVKNYTGGVLYKEYTNITEGEHTIYIQKNESGILFQSFGFTGSIDNVSVKEVGQDWIVLDTDATHYVEFSEEGARYVSDTTSPVLTLRQNISITSGTKYRFTIKLKNNGGTGNIKVQQTGITFVPNILDGTYTEDIVATANVTAVNIVRASTDVDLYIESFSIKEVTDDTNLPRINYEGFTYENGLPVPYSGKGHLLLEGQRSNIALSGGPLRYTNATETTNYGVSPSGDNDSIKLESTTATTSYVRTNALSTIGNQCHSIYVKKGIGDYIQLLQSADANHYASYDIVNGVVTASGSATTASIESYGDWYRLIAVYDSVTNTAADARCYLSDSATAGFGSASSAIGNYCEFWGVQVEIGDYATSYIANTTPSTTVTRLGETCNNATQSFPSEGVLYAEIAALANDGTIRYLGMSDGSSSNRVVILYDGTADRIRGIVSGGGTKHFDDTGYVTSALDFHKAAIRYKDNDYSLWVDGVLAASASSGTAPTGMDRLEFDLNSGGPFYSKSKMVATLPYLSDDEMIKLTR